MNTEDMLLTLLIACRTLLNAIDNYNDGEPAQDQIWLYELEPFSEIVETLEGALS